MLQTSIINSRLLADGALNLRNRPLVNTEQINSKQPMEFNSVIQGQLVKLNDLKFSAHARERIKNRHIRLSSEDMLKLGDAVDRAAEKGANESLMLINDTALVVSVKNRTVITALDRDMMSGNVFTNIDSAVVI